MSSTLPSRHIGVLAFDGVAALDLIGVVEAFTIANGGEWRTPAGRYVVQLVGTTADPITAESGVRLLADVTMEAAGDFDTVVVPGGPGLREPETQDRVAAWLKSRAPHVRRVVSVCTGLYGLAASGLMDGRRATSHWRHCADLRRRFPEVQLEPDAIFIKDGGFYSSAGMTAGIDLALALIEEDHGPNLALGVARQLVVYMKRAGGQMQYSEPLQFQTRAGDRFADLAAKVAEDMSGDWSVERMAAEAGLSSRQFGRRFKAAFGVAPRDYLEKIRLDEARRRLDDSREGLARIAHATGFSSDDALRRAFERRFGVTPSTYRGRFGSTDTA